MNKPRRLEKKPAFLSFSVLLCKMANNTHKHWRHAAWIAVTAMKNQMYIYKRHSLSPLDTFGLFRDTEANRVQHVNKSTRPQKYCTNVIQFRYWVFSPVQWLFSSTSHLMCPFHRDLWGVSTPAIFCGRVHVDCRRSPGQSHLIVGLEFCRPSISSQTWAADCPLTEAEWRALLWCPKNRMSVISAPIWRDGLC